MTKAVVERALGAELTHHLGYAQGGAPAEAGGNCRNGTSAKTLTGNPPSTPVKIGSTIAIIGEFVERRTPEDREAIASRYPLIA